MKLPSRFVLGVSSTIRRAQNRKARGNISWGPYRGQRRIRRRRQHRGTVASGHQSRHRAMEGSRLGAEARTGWAGAALYLRRCVCSAPGRCGSTGCGRRPRACGGTWRGGVALSRRRGSRRSGVAASPPGAASGTAARVPQSPARRQRWRGAGTPGSAAVAAQEVGERPDGEGGGQPRAERAERAV